MNADASTRHGCSIPSAATATATSNPSVVASARPSRNAGSAVSGTWRIVFADARLILAAVLLNLGSVLAPPPASAVLGDCGQPVSNAPDPTATDCLYILNAAVGLATCSPECICEPKGSSPISATDALVCLRHSVGQPVPLTCTCGSGSSTTTTTLGDGSVSCTIDSAICSVDPCICLRAGAGLDYHLGAEGEVTGPVGTQLRVNTQLMQGGDIDCGNWTKIGAAVNPSCDTIGCCERQSGEPETTGWLVGQAIESPCYCPEAPNPLQHDFIVQCQLGTDPPVEHEQATLPCESETSTTSSTQSETTTTVLGTTTTTYGGPSK